MPMPRPPHPGWPGVTCTRTRPFPTTCCGRKTRAAARRLANLNSATRACLMVGATGTSASSTPRLRRRTSACAFAFATPAPRPRRCTFCRPCGFATGGPGGTRTVPGRRFARRPAGRGRQMCSRRRSAWAPGACRRARTRSDGCPGGCSARTRPMCPCCSVRQPVRPIPRMASTTMWSRAQPPSIRIGWAPRPPAGTGCRLRPARRSSCGCAWRATAAPQAATWAPASSA